MQSVCELTFRGGGTYYIRLQGRISSEQQTIVQQLARQVLHSGFLLCWFVTLKMGIIRSPETSVHIRTTRRYIPEDGNIHSAILYSYSTLHTWVVNRASKIIEERKSIVAYVYVIDRCFDDDVLPFRFLLSLNLCHVEMRLKRMPCIKHKPGSGVSTICKHYFLQLTGVHIMWLVGSLFSLHGMNKFPSRHPHASRRRS
jgi:hypothetical protein